MSLENPNGSKDRLICPCGKCGFCLSNNRMDWSFRLNQELKVSESAHFITMTYNELCLPWGANQPTLDIRDTQLFIKRVRKRNLNKIMSKKIFATRKEAQKNSASIRYYLVGEYGTITQRPHYHAIMFNLQVGVAETLHKAWGLGHVHVDEVNPSTINYVCKYLINKFDIIEGVQKPFATMSRNPGIGSNYLQAKKYHITNDTTQVRNTDGNQQRLPRFYKEKFFTKYQLKKIALSSIAKADEYEETERQRIIKLGSNPAQYQQAQILTQLQKITINKSKTEIL